MGEGKDEKKAALKAILADYNTRYGTNHRISEFDLYYQDVQKRIKDQQWPNSDFPAAQKIDITIVVDMLLTGFDSKYLNTLYVDKNLKYHGLIQAFSRTNRVLNGTKPYGNILDFRQQQDAVDTAIAPFSGEKTGEQAREIWLVDKAPVVIEKLETAVQKLDDFMKSQGLDCTPSAVANLKGDAAKAAFITHFKEVQRLKTQLDQYTDLTEDNKASIDAVLPDENLRGFKGQYLETAKRLKDQQGKGTDKGDTPAAVEQLDFEFVLFASALIDYDYIMGLIARFSAKGPGKSKMTREELIGLISADAKFMNERDDIAEYIGTLKAGEGLSETAIRDGYTRFKAEKDAKELAAISARHGLATAALDTCSTASTTSLAAVVTIHLLSPCRRRTAAGPATHLRSLATAALATAAIAIAAHTAATLAAAASPPPPPLALAHNPPGAPKNLRDRGWSRGAFSHENCLWKHENAHFFPLRERFVWSPLVNTPPVGPESRVRSVGRSAGSSSPIEKKRHLGGLSGGGEITENRTSSPNSRFLV